jgi:hypothetical protein
VTYAAQSYDIVLFDFVYCGWMRAKLYTVKMEEPYHRHLCSEVHGHERV